MNKTTLITAAALALCATLGTGCHRERVSTPAGRYAMLQSPDEGDRRAAIKEMLESGGPTLQDVPALINALNHEPDPKNYGLILLGLGKTGAPEAKPYIDGNVNNPNKFVRERALAARDMWNQQHARYGAAPREEPQPPDTAAPPPEGAGGEPPQLPPPPPGSPPPPQPPAGQDI